MIMGFRLGPVKMLIVLEEFAGELLEMDQIVMRRILSEVHSRSLPHLTFPPFRSFAFIGDRFYPKVID